MGSPKISALMIGFFLGFVAPYAVFAVLGYTVAALSIRTSGELPAWLTIVGLLVAFAGPVIAGYMAAKVARVQPLLHGLIVGILGSVMFTFIGPLGAAIGFAIFVFIPGGVAGAWLWKRGKGAL